MLRTAASFFGFFATRSKPRKLMHVVSSDRGSAYSLSIAITLPFYALLVGLLVEWSLMQNVHVGVDYAAWAAARAAAVWLPAEQTSLSTQEDNADMVRRAAVNAISSWSSSISKAPESPNDASGADAVLAGYQSAAIGEQQKASYVKKKWNYANAATRVEFDPPLEEIRAAGTNENQIVRVTVHYQMPFNLPGIGRLFGRHNGACWVRDIQSTVELKLERPKTRNGRLGFEYDSRPVRAR